MGTAAASTPLQGVCAGKPPVTSLNLSTGPLPAFVPPISRSSVRQRRSATAPSAIAPSPRPTQPSPAPIHPPIRKEEVRLNVDIHGWYTAPVFVLPVGYSVSGVPLQETAMTIQPQGGTAQNSTYSYASGIVSGPQTPQQIPMGSNIVNYNSWDANGIHEIVKTGQSMSRQSLVHRQRHDYSGKLVGRLWIEWLDRNQ